MDEGWLRVREDKEENVQALYIGNDIIYFIICHLKPSNPSEREFDVSPVRMILAI